MIRIVTARRLAGTAAEVERLRARLEQASADAQSSRDREVADHLRLRAEVDQAERGRNTALFELDIANAAIKSLREEVAELVAEVKAAEEASAASSAHGLVFVLTRFEQLHSVHASHEDAQAEAERHGAAPGGWVTRPTPEPLAESPWRVTPLQYEPAPGVVAA
ncbi:hypothetical protein [Streptomyces sp. Z26]|uniref:hypothetical protein n=1 Tax=Streptomyces sp. Z26 TaxID=2500177 RepID=UPI000EF14EE5|nr:hypothetical protein [Streptomyces sp. Z26]